MPFNRLASFGALGVCAGILVVYAALAFLSTPTPVAGVVGATGGMDGTMRTVTWISALVSVALFLWSHVGFARQLAAGPSSLND